MLKYCIDLGMWMLAVPLAFILRLESHWLTFPDGLALLVAASMVLNAILIYWTGLYRRSWHRLGLRDLLALGVGIAAAVAVLELLTLIGLIRAPRSVPFIAGMLALLSMGGARVSARLLFEKSGRLAVARSGRSKNVLIAGAGDAGVMIAREMMRNFEANRFPIGFLDDAPYKQNQRLLGLEVLGPITSLPEVVLQHDVDEVLIAMPSQDGDVVRRVVELARVARVEHRTIPGMYELLSGKVSISQIREVDYEDLLRREPVRLEMDRIASYVDDQVILVTGAGGSIGSELVRQLARFEPFEIVLLERSEAHLYAIDIEIRDRYPEIRRTAVAGDVGDPDTLEDVFSRYHPDVVFHAAAYKHVPLMERHPWQAVLNNVGGTRNLAAFALEYAVGRFVNISTDKAVNPTSMMGASKRLAEMVVCAASKRADPLQSFVSVRFGNVLGSNGSVVPLFKKQIKQGGPVTVTHPEMTRYFMTIPEASQLVLQAGSTAENGDVYVLDMGEPVKIVDLAKDLIMLSGLRLGEDIDIAFTGTRPGEKLFEEILTEEEGTAASSHEKIFVAKNRSIPEAELDEALERLFAAARRRDEAELRRLVAELIPTNCFGEGDGRNGAASHHWAARVN
jgi:FlaA1/EpsC-like NDP-sugar epimerase